MVGTLSSTRGERISFQGEVQMETRITLGLSAREWQGLQQLSGETMRTPRGQLRWLLREELARRGLQSATERDFEGKECPEHTQKGGE